MQSIFCRRLVQPTRLQQISIRRCSNKQIEGATPENTQVPPTFSGLRLMTLFALSGALVFFNYTDTATPIWNTRKYFYNYEADKKE